MEGSPCSRGRLDCISHVRQRVRALRAKTFEESGVELFEFAVVAPLLLMLLLGIFWIGRAYNVYETITRAAREGARYAVLPSSAGAGNAYPDASSSACASGTNTFNNYVAPVLTSSALDPTQVQSYCQRTLWLENTNPRQCGVEISFTYPVQLAVPFTSLSGTTINIRARAQMRQENQSAGGTCP
jgi:Flp pilus assembly protein TadG